MNNTVYSHLTHKNHNTDKYNPGLQTHVPGLQESVCGPNRRKLLSLIKWAQTSIQKQQPHLKIRPAFCGTSTHLQHHTQHDASPPLSKEKRRPQHGRTILYPCWIHCQQKFKRQPKHLHQRNLWCHPKDLPAVTPTPALTLYSVKHLYTPNPNSTSTHAHNTGYRRVDTITAQKRYVHKKGTKCYETTSQCN
jgi:hypothetical protein